MRLIDEAPRTGIRGSRVAFLHPASTGGVLTEIVQPAEEWTLDVADDKPQKINDRIPRRAGAEREGGAEVAQALPRGTGHHRLARPDGRRRGMIAIDLEKVVYVLVDTEGHRVGFGT